MKRKSITILSVITIFSVLIIASSFHPISAVASEQYQTNTTPTPPPAQTVDQSETAWAVALDKLAVFISLCVSPCIWPLMLLITILWFNKPIRVFLERVARSADSIEIAGNKVSLAQVNGTVVERELLRTAISIAISDKNYRGDELECLGEIVTGMEDEWDDLDEQDKEKILRTAVKIALADNELADIEYVRLNLRAEALGIKQQTLDRYIVEKVIGLTDKEITLPESLGKKVTAKIAELSPK